MNVIITGANRGIGLGFVRHYLNCGCHVWACVRDVSVDLKNLESAHLHVVQWDIREVKSENFFVESGVPASIDLLINNAGIYGTGKQGQSLEAQAPEDMLDTFYINCVAHVMVVQGLWARVAKARGVIANLSSKMGSIADNTSGGTYAYRASKAALVICGKSMAVDLASYGVSVITLHPGYVKTDMTHHQGLIDVETSVAGMADVLARANDYESGSFVAFNGEIVPF